MKKFNKKFGMIGWVLAAALVFMGARIGGNITRFGAETGANISLLLGNGIFRWDDTAQQLKFSNDGGSSEKSIGSGGGAGGGLNLLVDNNFDFESGDPPSSWVSSGGTFVAETVNPLNGGQSGLWDSSVAAQNLDSPLKTVPITLEGNSCLARIFYKWETGVAGDIKLQALDSSSNILSELDLVPTTGQVREAFVTFICPTADTIRLRLTSTTNANVITVDDAHLGSNIKEIQVASTELMVVARYNGTTNCLPAVTSTSFVTFGTDTDCVGMVVDKSNTVVTTADNDELDLIIPSLPPGDYVLKSTMMLIRSAINIGAVVRITDGTNNGPSAGFNDGDAINREAVTVHLYFTQTTAGAKSFKIQGRSDSGTLNIENSTPTSIPHDMYWELIKYPLGSESAISFDKSKFFISANIGGANPALGVSAQAAYIEITDAGLDLVQNSVSDAVGIACIGTEEGALGQFTCTGNESVGVVFNADADVYRACVWFAHAQDGANGDTAFQIVETPNNAQTISQEGNARIGTVNRGTGLQHAPPSSCGEFSFASAGKKTLRLMYEQSLTAATTNIIMADRAASAGQRDIHWTVERIHERRGGITFNNLPSTANADGEKLATVTIDYQGTGVPVVLADSASIVLSLVDNGVGDVTVNFVGGTWVNPVDCGAIVRDNAAAHVTLAGSAPSTGSVRYRIWSDAGAPLDPGTAGEGLTVRCEMQK